MEKSSGVLGVSGTQNPYDRSRNGVFEESAQRRTPSRRFTWCCCIAFLTFGILVTIAVLLLFVYFALKPREPTFNLQDVSISSFEVEQPLTGTSSYEVFLSLNCTLFLVAHNPNKLKIKYNALKLNVFYNEHQVGTAIAPAFDQPAHSNTISQAYLLIQKINVFEGDAQNLLNDAVNGSIPFSMWGIISARVSTLSLKSPYVQVGIRCEVVMNPQQRQASHMSCGVQSANKK